MVVVEARLGRAMALVALPGGRSEGRGSAGVWPGGVGGVGEIRFDVFFCWCSVDLAGLSQEERVFLFEVLSLDSLL